MPRSSMASTEGSSLSSAEKDVSLQVMVPARLKREVALKAAREGTTQRTLILTALRAIGLAVQDHELCDKRKVR